SARSRGSKGGGGGGTAGEAGETTALVYPERGELRYTGGVMALDLPAAGWTSRIARLLEDLDFAISPAIETAFSVYLDQVVTWNARMDLTAARTLDELVDLSFADAVVIAREERRRSGALEARWADVGSGAGAPGIPLFLLLSEG